MLGTPDTLLLERSDTMPNNNLYIGERYIPLFANPVEWDSSRAYEHLTIVMYEGEGYTSRYAVPPGIEIDDGKYWVKTFPRSPKILELEALIESIKTELAQQADEIAYIKEQIKRLGDIDALEERMSVAEQEIDDIQAVDNRQNERLTALEEDMQQHEGEYDDIKQKVEQNTDDINAIKLEQQEQNSRLEAVEQRNQQQDTRLTNIEAKDTAQDTEIANIKTEQQTQNSRLEAVEQRNTQQDEILADLEAKDTEQDNRLTAIEQKDTAQDTEIEAIKQEQTVQNSDISVLKQEQTIQNTDISNLKTLTTEQTKNINQNATNITRINETLVTIAERQNNIEDRQNNQEVELNAFGNEITAIETTQVNQSILINQNSNEITDIHGDVTNLQNSLSATDLNVATLTENLTQTNTKVTNIEGQIEEINEKLENVPGEITDLTAQVNKNTEEIQKNDTDILALQTKTNTIETQVGTITSDVDAVEEKNTEQDNRLDAIEQKNTAQDTAITAIQTKNTELETELDGQKVIVDGLTDDYQSLSQQVSGVISKVDTNTNDIDVIEQRMLTQTKYVVNVKNHGAKGDGVTDDTNAIKSAVNELLIQSRTMWTTLLFPDGIYIISEHIELEGFVVIKGIGMATIQCTASGEYPYVFDCGTHNMQSFFIINNIVFNKNAIGASAINFVNVGHITINNCEFLSVDTGIFARSEGFPSAHIRIGKCKFVECNVGIRINASEALITDILVENSTITNVNTFIRGSEKIEYLRLINNNMRVKKYLMNWNGSVGNRLHIESCYMYSEGVLINFYTTQKCNFLSIINNNITGLKNANDFRFANFNSVTIINNTIDNSTHIAIIQNAYDCRILNNAIYGKNSGSQVIGLISAFNTIISGNIIDLGRTSDKGIILKDSSKILITSNMFIGGVINPEYIVNDGSSNVHIQANYNVPDA